MTTTKKGTDMAAATPPPTVHQAIAAAAAEIGAVGKDSKMQAGPAKYNYRGIDDLVDAVHPIIAAHGVTFAPDSINVLDRMEKTTRSGSTQYHLRAIVTYHVYGPAGDHIAASVLAEGTDTGDKAGNKLMSGAYKYALSQVLSVPFSMDDQDAEYSEPVAPPAANLNIMNSEEAMEVIVANAEKLGKSLEDVTSKYRAAHGGIGTDELLETPELELISFAKQLAAYTAGR